MKKVFMICIIGAALFFGSNCFNQQPNILQDLKCEYLINPLGIENPHPRLSWIFTSAARGARQSAYQILVASSQELLESGQADLWDSGKIQSDNSIQVPYGGKKLLSRQKVYWRVRIWDRNDQPIPWSASANWEMGLLQSDDWQAHWIGNPGETDSSDSSPLFRKQTDIQKTVVKARAYISGLGYYELYINGNKVGSRVLSPNQSNYDRRRVEKWTESRVGAMATRVYYEIHDITEFIQEGENIFGVWLGGGWYIQNDWLSDPMLLYDTPRFIAQFEMEFEDGSKKIVISDDSWITHPSPVLHNGLHSGEIFDARLEIAGWNLPGLNVRDWDKTVKVRAPTGALRAQISPPDRIVRSIKPKHLSVLEPGIYRYDLGEMISGWVQLNVSGPEGAGIKLKFIEELGPSYGQTDTYILKGTGNEIWEPRFTWHAFRYVDVTSPDVPLVLDNLQGRVVNTDVKTAGSFKCSNQLFNQIHDNFRRTQLGNMHGGIPSDCPHRERRGYTGDGQIAAKAAIYCFDMAAFYSKWLQDIADAQNRNSGYVPNTAPYQDGGGGTAWGSASVIIPWYMYLYYGDWQILRDNYVMMNKWLSYLYNQLDERGVLINQGLGEWVPPGINELPPDFVNTCYYYHNCILMSKISDLLGETSDRNQYLTWAENARKSINKYYLDQTNNSYATGRQGANVFPIAFEITPEGQIAPVLQNIINHLNQDCQGHFDTGILGTPLLLDILTDYGYIELAYTLMNQHDYPSYGYMIDQGATTIWETWEGDQSHSHPMYGSVCQWFYQALSGIKPDETKPGFKHIIIKPHPVEGLSFVESSFPSPYGLIRSDWQIKGNNFYLSLSIPANTIATIYIPANSPDKISESNESVRSGSNISYIGMADDYAVFEVAAGKYDFISESIENLISLPRLSAPFISPGDTLVYQPDSVQIRIISEHQDAEIYYTLDDSEPDKNTYLYQNPFYVSENTTVQARIYKENRQAGYIKRRIIHFVDPLLNGLTWQYYEGQWMFLPDYENLHPEKVGNVLNFDLNQIMLYSEEFGLVFKGYIKITRSGSYKFFTMSNDGSCLYINNQLVVNNDGAHGPVEKSGEVYLNQGFYSIRCTYFQAGGGMFLKVSYAGPGISKQEIPAHVLYRMSPDR